MTKKRRRGVGCCGVERFFCLDFFGYFLDQDKKVTHTVNCNTKIYILFLLNNIRTNLIIVLKFKQHK